MAVGILDLELGIELVRLIRKINYLIEQLHFMGFHINKKTEAKNVSKNSKGLPQAGASKFIAKSNTKSSGAMKKPIKTGGARGS
jgi:hypothetical protein